MSDPAKDEMVRMAIYPVEMRRNPYLIGLACYVTAIVVNAASCVGDVSENLG